jgi:serine/threonine-protein kinase RsbW
MAETSFDLLGTVELQIPSKPEWVAVARLAVAAIANRLPFSVEEIEDVKLAIAEACTICRDAARTEELTDKRPSTLAVEGLGIFLIQALMDVVEYRVDSESGTELVMTKRVSA